MNIAIKRAGICTAKICSVDDLCDQLLEKNRSYKVRQDTIIETVQLAVREAKAADLPMIQVNSKNTEGTTLYAALCEAETMPEAAIICSQENEFGYEDVAVLVTSTNPGEKAWAVITGVEQGIESSSLAAKVYRLRGPVQEACALIAECAALRYELSFTSLEGEGQPQFELNRVEEEHKVSIHGGQVLLKRAEVVDESSISITKHLVPLSFSTKDEILEKLSQLVQLVHRLSLEEISKNVRKGFFENKNIRRTVVLAAKDSEQLLQEIECFLKEQSCWDVEGYVWQTEAGSFYTATPLQAGGKVCIVNPPATMFSKMAFYRLYRALPMVKKQIPKIHLKKEESQPLIAWYVFESWTRKFALETLGEFGIQFDQAVGMGLGELSLPYILGYVTFEEKDVEDETSIPYTMEASIQLLRDLLLSRPELVERYLKNMPEGAVENWYVMCEEEKAKQAVLELRDSKFKVKDELGYEVYSTSLLRKLEKDSPLVAEAIVGSITKQVDLPLIIRQIYKEGGRVFLSLGSGGRCNQWIRECLQDRPDVLVTSMFERESPADSLSLLLAQCMSYGIPIDYEKCYSLLSWEQKQESEEELRAKLMQHLIGGNHQPHSHSRMELDRQCLNEVSECHAEELASIHCEAEPVYLYGKDEILEMTEDSMARILGSHYQESDQYEIRARMPLPPFLFVTGITKIAAEYQKFEAGSYIEGEFCITKDTPLRMNESEVSNVVLVEAAHIGRFLMAYMGIDAASHGTSRYEINEIITEYYTEDRPKVGEVARLHYSIDRFEKSQDSMRLYSTYDIQFNGKPFMELKIKGRCYNPERCQIPMSLKEKQRPEVMLRNRCPVYHPLTGRHRFSKNEMTKFLYGDVSSCFGKPLDSTPISYWQGEEALLIDRVLDISSEGGDFGYGYILTEKIIDELFWPFAVHFKNDPVVPETLIMEMITQSILFFATYMGLHSEKAEESPRQVKNHPSRFRCAGRINKGEHTLIIKVEPRKVEQVEEEKVLIYDGMVYCDGIQIVKQEGNALWIP